MNNYDVGIVGAGIAGAFAAFRLAQEHKNIKTILFDLGRPPMKRRRQLEGWLGCLPNSDGKLYTNNISKVSEITGIRKAKSANNYFTKVISNIDNFKVTKDKSLSVSMEKKLKKYGYDFILNDFIQIYPKDVHALSKYMSETMERNRNVFYSFDDEVKSITKQRSMFIVTTENGEYRCKKIILAVGRSGWRWATELFTKFGIIENNDIAKFGIRVEMHSSILKDFNKSACTIFKDNLEIGPLNWYGSIIPEDHLDMAISAFRSNENRWKTDKVSFNMIGDIIYPNKGFEQTDRLGKLTFVLANDRVIKERVSHILTNKSKISIIPEYEWLKQAVADFSNVVPEVASKAYFHVPTIVPFVPEINIGNNLETEVNGLFVAGENAGVHGILSAAITGIIAADMTVK
jgi:uncharacterized FAD-dependent dehydrogenase